MPINPLYLAHFEFEGIYHIYNRTNNKELLFKSDNNYAYFLHQFAFFISPIADTYAWSLLPNHFHFLIKIKTKSQIAFYIESLDSLRQTKSEKEFLLNNDINHLIEANFKRFFTSYAMAFNKMHNRKGNLFQRTFKRVEITRDQQFTKALIYIHANAQKHKLVKYFADYLLTSYHSLLSDKQTRLLRDEIFEWFGNKEKFIKVQHALTEYYYQFEGSIQDDD
ncbi:MAG: hypothetical protein ABIP30_11435 [Ferruginibacter sp.]